MRRDVVHDRNAQTAVIHGPRGERGKSTLRRPSGSRQGTGGSARKRSSGKVVDEESRTDLRSVSRYCSLLTLSFKQSGEADPVEAERRQVTVLFADMVGFTAFSE
jgi:class 3 adenylate cyclase